MTFSTIRTCALILMIFLLTACSMPDENTAGNLTPTTPQEESPPTSAPAEGSLRPALAVVGPEEVVFDWSTDACAPEDIPDLPARAFRDADGQVHLVSSHLISRASVGPSLDDLTHQCEPIMTSDHAANPAQHNDNEWIAGLYTEDGQTVYASIHYEYHGWEHNDCAGFPAGSFACWYNALTWAVSTDGGHSFTDAFPPPAHFVAGLPHPYEAGAGPYGVMEPSNIIRAKDGYYYQFAKVDDYRSDDQWSCLMRTDNLVDPASWRAWGGEDFDVAFLDIYAHPEASREDNLCAPIAQNEIGNMTQSVTYNTFLDRYVLVGLSADHLDGREVWGIYYAFSEDMIHWTHRQLLWERELPWTWQPGDDQTLLYPALLDPDSLSLSFETTDQQVYLYYTKFNGGNPLDRDLIRVPVAFFWSEAESLAADTRTSLSLALDSAASEAVVVSGQLTRADGSPVPGQLVDIFVIPSEGPGEVVDYQITDRIPEQASGAIMGYRVNLECDCSGGASEFDLYQIAFQQGDDPANLVPDPNFSNGLASLELWQGSEFVSLEPDDQGGGNILHFQSGANQTAGANPTYFPVSGGETFTATFTARVPPLSQGTGLFLVIFTDASGEVIRYTRLFNPSPVSIGTAETGADGAYSFTWENPTDNATLEAFFAGDGVFLPSEDALTVVFP